MVWICGRSLAGIAVSNPIGGMNICHVKCYVLSSTGLCVGLIARPEESYRVCVCVCLCVPACVRVSECVRQALVMKRSCPLRAPGKKIYKEKQLKYLFKYIRFSFRMFPESFYCWEIQNITIISVVISFSIILLCNYSLLPATVYMLQTFPRPFCHSFFSSSVAFLMMSVASKKCWFQFRKQVKISCSRVRRVLSHFIDMRSLNIAVKEKSTVGCPFFEAFHSDFILKAMTGNNVNFFIHRLIFAWPWINDINNIDNQLHTTIKVY